MALVNRTMLQLPIMGMKHVKLNYLALNFRITDDLAYTEDDIVVHNIFVHGIHRSVNSHHISEYFSKFGQVVKVRLVSQRYRYNCHRNSCGQGIAFVNFMDPYCAARVLTVQSHAINNRRIMVRACDSWHQPDASRVHCDGEIQDNSNTLLLKMNTDCLVEIFKYLDLGSQVNMALTCRALADVFALYAKTKFKTFSIHSLGLLTLWQIRHFFSIAGNQIQHIWGWVPPGDFKRGYEFMGWCTNLKILNIENSVLASTVSRKLFKNMPLLTELHLNDMGLDDTCVSTLKHLKHLKKLSLGNNYYLTGKHIKQLANLESLWLTNNPSLLPIHLSEIFKRHTNLKYLDIGGAQLREMTNVMEMTKNLINLETLHVAGIGRVLVVVPALPKLKHLHLHLSEEPGAFLKPLCEELVRYHGEDLESLAFYSDWWMGHDITMVLGQLKALKFLRCPKNIMLGDECLEDLSNLANLEALIIRHIVGYTPDALFNLIAKCTKLNILNLGKNSIVKEEFVNRLLHYLTVNRSIRGQTQALRILGQCTPISAWHGLNTDLLKVEPISEEFMEDYDSDGRGEGESDDSEEDSEDLEDWEIDLLPPDEFQNNHQNN